MHSPHLSLRHYGPSPGSHSHDHYQLLWGWQGRLELEIEGRGACVSSGRLAVIAPGDRHDFWSSAGSRCFVVDGPEDHAGLAPLAGRVVDTAPSTLHLLRFLAAQGAEGGLPQPAAAALLLATVTAHGSAAPTATRRAIDWAALDLWLDARLGEPLSVAQMALQVCLSPSQFAARCVEETGWAPMAYLRQRRLQQARRLRAQGWQVQQIAERCGYRSPSALTAALRRADAAR
ncbi:helix-turn-helix domain-containing protein [Caldimonas brevitalea]|uniref:Transcriptional regulator, AraC family n=1 Tax=Caldimonas brevitalea TaxID=413882 RepID=A0A0G3BE60_9BURK|nr:AraC family transcriptional regulator [Caldimonas brevitalea]AKJ27592.1 transcriptional regulator, AraC family [Caldimonas brevitalea]